MARVTASSMSFLARLAPSVHAAVTGVRAALPARFAPAGTAEPLLEQTAETAAAWPAAYAPHPALNPAPQQMDADAPARTAPAAAPLFSPAHQATPPSFAPRETGSPPRPFPAAPLPHAEDPLRSDQAAWAPAISGLPSRAEVLTAATQLPLGSSPAAPASATPLLAEHSGPAPAAHAPLRTATVAQRTLPATTNTPSVVHVTIDRIDVRLPSPVAAVPHASPAHHAASTLPLDEYLRQRGKLRNGGTP